MLLSDICDGLTLAELKEKSKKEPTKEPAKPKLDKSKLDAKTRLALRKAVISTPVAKGDPMAALLTQVGGLTDKVDDNTDSNDLEQTEIIHNQEVLKKHEEQLDHIDRVVHRAEDEIAQLKSQVDKLLRKK